MKPEEIINNTKNEICEEIKEKLENIEKDGQEEIYFHDIITECVDSNTPQDRRDGLALIDLTNNEQHIDEGIIDHTSIDRMIITTAYECLHQEIFDDNFFQTLQDLLNNETIDFKNATLIIPKINKYMFDKGFKKVTHENNKACVWIKKNFPLSIEDFKEPSFNKAQLVNLSEDSIKILTSNKKINQNAIVLEHADRNEFRIYIVDPDKDLDMRELFKVKETSIGEHNGYNLSPEAYIHGKFKDVFSSKKEFMRVIQRVCSGLTARTI